MLPKKPDFLDKLKDAATILEDSFLPWVEPQSTEKDISREDLLHNEVSGLVTYLSPQPYETRARQMLISYMTSVVQSRWRSAHVSAFGSTATGLGLPNGDIDLVISFEDLGTHLGAQYLEKQVRRRLMNIEDEFVRAGITRQVTRVFFARVPIISFSTSSSLGALKVDVSVATGDDAGRKAIPLVKSYIEEMPALRALILCIKMFLSPRGLNNAAQSTLSSYAITLICISFLQRNPMDLPSDFISHPTEKKSLGVLLKDFFKYYAYEFPLATHYVSVSGMDIFPKENKEWKVQATPMLSVECIINPGPNIEQNRLLTMCADKDITRGASKIRAVLDAFRYASDTLSSSPLVPGESLLGKVIQVPKNMEESRKQLKAVMDNGAFDRAVSISSRSRVQLSYSNGRPPPSLLERMSDRKDRDDRYERGYNSYGRDSGRQYRNDSRQIAGSRPGDQWRTHSNRQYRSAHHQSPSEQTRSLDVRSRSHSTRGNAIGLPERPLSFDYMRSMEKREIRH